MAPTSYVAVFAFLEKDGKFLSMRRSNTGYMDGHLTLPSGHVEVNETPNEAVIREVKEEVGIDLALEKIQHCHAQHYLRFGDRIYTNHYYWAKCDGEPFNAEPEKCSELVWQDIDQDSPDILKQVKLAFRSIKEKKHYSEITLQEGEIQ
ncbi:MAG: NUDIX domain-containing protein [Alphaproteobacteria bacterium]|nr:NUDIX domain-containing protein [Alphaproteobacteria bacterium]MDD9920447.1 NUDIX domain-containing protein [Alphaproteobacteria bacterium]